MWRPLFQRETRTPSGTGHHIDAEWGGMHKMPCVLSSVQLCGFSGTRSPPDRFGGVGLLLVLAQRPPHHHQDRKDETLHHRRDLRHVELVPVPPRQKRGPEGGGPAAPVLPARG